MGGRRQSVTFSHNQDPLQNSLVYETLNQANVVLVTAMPVVSLDHVQLAMPPDREGEARAFYEKVLQIPEARRGLHRALRTMPEDVAAYKGIAPARARLLSLVPE